MQLECVNLKLAATIERPRPELPILAPGRCRIPCTAARFASSAATHL